MAEMKTSQKIISEMFRLNELLLHFQSCAYFRKIHWWL